jgi:hypothetical protein
MLALFLRKTKVIFARGTLSVNMSVTVSSFTFLKIDELLRFVDKLDEFLVFLLSFVNIS